MSRRRIKGIGVVEVVIAAAIISAGILSLITTFSIYVKYALGNSGNVEAAYLAEEGLEAMTLMRGNGWKDNILPLSTTTTYYLKVANGMWATTTTAQYVDSTFLRTITLTDVNRDTNSLITSSGGTYDPNTKLVTVTLNYFQGHATTTRSISTYLTNLNND